MMIWIVGCWPFTASPFDGPSNVYLVPGVDAQQAIENARRLAGLVLSPTTLMKALPYRGER